MARACRVIWAVQLHRLSPCSCCCQCWCPCGASALGSCQATLLRVRPRSLACRTCPGGDPALGREPGLVRAIACLHNPPGVHKSSCTCCRAWAPPVLAGPTSDPPTAAAHRGQRLHGHEGGRRGRPSAPCPVHQLQLGAAQLGLQVQEYGRGWVCTGSRAHAGTPLQAGALPVPGLQG